LLIISIELAWELKSYDLYVFCSCPGSVKFIFRLKNGTTYLHTGDFRYTPSMLLNPWVKSLAKVDCLYLDTTYEFGKILRQLSNSLYLTWINWTYIVYLWFCRYCDPKYDFPSQAEAIRQVVNAVKTHLIDEPKTLVVCGSYTIGKQSILFFCLRFWWFYTACRLANKTCFFLFFVGKERVFITLGEALNIKVFCTSEKRRLIGEFENSKFTNMLTNIENDSNIHVLQMRSISPQVSKVLVLIGI